MVVHLDLKVKEVRVLLNILFVCLFVCLGILGGGLSPTTKPKGFSESELYLEKPKSQKKNTPTSDKATPIHMQSLPIHLVKSHDSERSLNRSLPMVKVRTSGSGGQNEDRVNTGGSHSRMLTNLDPNYRNEEMIASATFVGQESVLQVCVCVCVSC